MRLGLVDQEELQKFRRALRSSKKFALQSPQLREKLADLLDKLIDLTTKDPATYSRVRYNVVNKEANALLDKAEKSDLPVDVIYEVFTRGYQINNSFNEAFNRVNSFIAGGKAAQMDEDLKGACWKNYKAVGMKMKNGKKVPNCVPEETQVDEISSGVYKRAMNKAAHRAMWDAEGIHGKKYKKYAPMARKFQKKGIEQEKKEKSRKVNESFSEQLMTTHPAVPLSKRMKRVKSFHAWHPKPVKETYIGAEPASNNPNDPANRFVGTNTIRQNYANVTPGQGSAAGEIAIAKFAPEKVDYSSALIKKTRTEVDQSKENLGQKHLKDIKKALSGIREQNELNESFAAGFELAPFARDYGITVQSSFQHHPEVQAALDAQEDAMNEATYQGREVPLGKPMKGDVKKSKVYVRDPSTGNIKKVNFGDKKLSIKKDQPERKKSYCARSSGQGNLNKKTSANYWSRRAWDC
jgi:hypothetical protein